MIYNLLGSDTTINAQINGTSIVSIDTATLTLGTSIAFLSSLSAITFSQADKITNGGTGGVTTIHAQNETGTGSTGGNLILASGTGSTNSGSIFLKMDLILFFKLALLALPLLLQVL